MKGKRARARMIRAEALALSAMIATMNVMPALADTTIQEIGTFSLSSKFSVLSSVLSSAPLDSLSFPVSSKLSLSELSVSSSFSVLSSVLFSSKAAINKDYLWEMRRNLMSEQRYELMAFVVEDPQAIKGYLDKAQEEVEKMVNLINRLCVNTAGKIRR